MMKRKPKHEWVLCPRCKKRILKVEFGGIYKGKCYHRICIAWQIIEDEKSEG